MNAQSLKDFCKRILEQLGVSAEDAQIAADVLIAADLRGIESHGVARLRTIYVDGLRTDMAVPRPNIRVLRETSATALMDGGSGLGHPTACKAMKLAIEKAHQVGAGFVTVRNSNHFGIAGYYAMMALESGCIGMAMTNSCRWVVPTFGRDAMLGTNPIAVAVPSGQERPFVLDMATSAVSIGKLEVYARLAKAIPYGWASDESGGATTNPDLVLNNVERFVGGGLLPLGGLGEEMGGHKGYGLAVWVDIFSALLSSEQYADLVWPTKPGGKPNTAHVGHFFGAWRVDAFRPLGEFEVAMDDLLRRLKSSPKGEGQNRIYVAGEKEFEETERRTREGIPLPAVVVADLKALGIELGVAFSAAECHPQSRNMQRSANTPE